MEVSKISTHFVVSLLMLVLAHVWEYKAKTVDERQTILSFGYVGCVLN